MKRRIKIAVVGRPNVGKSALFNRICKKRLAIVDEMEGVTRDRLYADSDLFGTPFQVIDTGGIDPCSKVPYQEEIRRQAEIAIEEADCIIMVVDSQVGVTALDEDVAKILLRKEKHVCVAVNKIDDFSQQDRIFPFYCLGISKVLPVSAMQGFNIAEIVECAISSLPPVLEEVEKEPEGIRVAIIGRPNAGKSTLVNCLLQDERCVVSPLAGTTRDSIDAYIKAFDTDFTLIDTAGIRRKKKEIEAVEKFAAIRTTNAIDRADVCVLMLDADRGMTAEDKKIASDIEAEGKGCILVFNKWDLVEGYRMEHCLNSLRIDTSFLNHCPALFISAKEGRNVNKLLPAVKEVYANLMKRVTTGQLNKFLEKAMQKYHPPMIQGKRLRIYYMAQVDVSPPRFVMFVNDPNRMAEAYRKYLINQFREEYAFTGVPLTFSLKGKKSKDLNERLEESSGKIKAPAAPKEAASHAFDEVSEEDLIEYVKESDDIFSEEELDPSYF